MEALGLPSLTLPRPSCHNLRTQQHVYSSASTNCFKISDPSVKLSPFRTPHKRILLEWWHMVMTMRPQQMKEMAAAKKRWDALEKFKCLHQGKLVMQFNSQTKPYLMFIHPQNAWVKGSTGIPIFDVDNRLDAGLILRKIANFVMGHSDGFKVFQVPKSHDYKGVDGVLLSKVEEKFKKDTNIIVACQKGLSLDAYELLYNAGYQNLIWVQGGCRRGGILVLNEKFGFPVLLARTGEGGLSTIKLAGTGGVSEFLGWADQQRAQAAKEGWGYHFASLIFFLVGLVSALSFHACLIILVNVGAFLVADILFLGSLGLEGGTNQHDGLHIIHGQRCNSHRSSICKDEHEVND
ncbi:LOW QUALITY PROTEIN: hypothetical protein RJ641_009086 [Dillenia turbinata]|uniref:Rhodanese domain-containing protein n=1 Tax=Dillenia turbinata TaxID=194707 RepID=A0AAN8UZC8_9MAGN